MKSKEEILKLSEHAAKRVFPYKDDVFKDVEYAIKRNIYQHGFIEGFEYADQQTEELRERVRGLEISVKKTEEELHYWNNRCYHAELCLKESPCDPDITTDQINAHNLWERSKEGRP